MLANGNEAEAWESAASFHFLSCSSAIPGLPCGEREVRGPAAPSPQQQPANHQPCEEASLHHEGTNLRAKEMFIVVCRWGFVVIFYYSIIVAIKNNYLICFLSQSCEAGRVEK